ncbi:MAG: hypothetical protein AAF825_02800 [Pseudomonadota bacterium]
MLDVESIVDEESLEAWLKSLPEERLREATVNLASRAALRVLPLALADETFWAGDVRLGALPVFWAISISEVAAVYPISKIAADRADAHATTGGFAILCIADEDAAYFASAQTTANAAYAAAFAACVAAYESAIEAAYAGGHAATSAAYQEFDLWPMIRWDARSVANETTVRAAALWPNMENPFAAHWEKAKANMPRPGGEAPTDGPTIETHGDWTFWVDWYGAHLAGNPFSVGLLKKIVELPEDPWLTDPVELNRRVMEIYEA